MLRRVLAGAVARRTLAGAALPCVTVLAAGFGGRPHRSAAASSGSAIEFDKVAPVNMDDIEVPAFLRYRG